MTSRLSVILLFAALALPFSACADGDANPDPNNPPHDNGGGGGGGDIPVLTTCQILTLSSREQAIYDDIMAERAEVNLPAIPASASLMYVARTHAVDSAAHQATAAAECNLHSWSDKGAWTVCCYTSDHANASCMWSKPKELTTFKGSGYEISAWASGGGGNPVAQWMGSAGHRAVIMNEGSWEKMDFKSIGIGTSGNYTHVWFGVESECP